jgi:hypothetical protein
MDQSTKAGKWKIVPRGTFWSGMLQVSSALVHKARTPVGMTNWGETGPVKRGFRAALPMFHVEHCLS